MGKVVSDTGPSDNLFKEKKSKRNEKPSKAKKKRNKKDLNELHRKVLDAKEVLPKRPPRYRKCQSAFEKVLNEFADQRAECDRNVKGTKQKLGKAQEPQKICNRILPQRLTGIYRNGARGKEVQKSQAKTSLAELHNARIESDVFKLVDADETNTQNVVTKPIAKFGQKQSLSDNTTEQCRRRDSISNEISDPIQIEAVGEKNTEENSKKKIDTLEAGNSRRNEDDEAAKVDWTDAFKRYTELGSIIATKVFEGNNPIDKKIEDPLRKLKKKIRCVYDDTYQSVNFADAVRMYDFSSDIDTAIEPSSSASVDDFVYLKRMSNPFDDPCATDAENETTLLNFFQTPTQQMERENNGEKQNLGSHTDSALGPSCEFAKTETTKETAPLRNLLLNSSMFSSDDTVSRMKKIDEHLQKKLNKSKDTLSTMTKSLATATQVTSDTFDTRCVRYESDIERDFQSNYFGSNKPLEKKPANVASCFPGKLRKEKEWIDMKIYKNQRSRNDPTLLRRRNSVYKSKTQPVKVVDKLNLCDESDGSIFADDIKEKLVQRKKSAIPKALLQVVEAPRTENDCTMMHRGKPGTSKQCKSQNSCISIELGSEDSGSESDFLVSYVDTVQSKRLNHLKESKVEEGFFKKNQKQTRHSSNKQNPSCSDLHNKMVQQPEKYRGQRKMSYKDKQCSCNECKHQSLFQDTNNKSDVSKIDKHLEMQRKLQIKQKMRHKTHENLRQVFYQPEDTYNVEHSGNPDELRYIGSNMQVIPNKCLVYRENLSDVGILNGVQNLRILNDDQEIRAGKIHGGKHCSSRTFCTDSAQPIKYLALEHELEPRRVPLYPQQSSKTIDLQPKCNSNCHNEKIILVPSCKGHKVVYTNTQNYSNSGGFPGCAQSQQHFCQARFEETQDKERNSNGCCSRHLASNSLGKSKAECSFSNRETRGKVSVKIPGMKIPVEWEALPNDEQCEWPDSNENSRSNQSASIYYST